MEYVKLGDYCIITSSKRIFANQYVSKGVPFFRSKEIIEKNNSQNISEPLYISTDVYNEIKNKFGVPQIGDVLLTSVGTLGIPYLVKEESFYFKDGNLTWMKDFSKKLSSKYLYYWLSSSFGRISLLQRAIGSSQPAITIEILKKYKIILPSINTQHRIASILSAYDNLIENNNKRIRLLEQMAENLYKEWFVRFRFPGHEKAEFENTKLGKLPKSFSITNMDSVFEDYIGGGWGNDDESEDFPISACVIRGADFPNVWHYDVSTCPRRYHKKSNYKARQLQDGDIVMEISGGTSEQPVGRTVLVTQDMIDRFEGGRVICASFCKMIRLKKEIISPYFFYFWMHYLYDTRIIDRFQLQSTGIINFKFEPFLKKGIVMLPPKELMQSFEDIINPIFKEINQLAIQNDNLSRQRDFLLPRLMSGKLEI